MKKREQKKTEAKELEFYDKCCIAAIPTIEDPALFAYKMVAKRRAFIEMQRRDIIRED